MLKRNVWLYYVLPVMIGISVIAVTVIRAATTGITYDEAFTYIHYADPHTGLFDMLLSWAINVFQSLLNNHWLNSILIYFFSKILNVQYSELIVRMPNIIAGIIYIVFAIRMLLKKDISLLTYILLVCNYYLMEFFGLARGYGLATMFAFLAVYYYIQWAKSHYVDKRILFLHLLMLILSASSNTISLIMFPGFLVLVLFRLIQNKNLKEYMIRFQLFILWFLCSSIFLGVFTVWTSREGNPVYSGNEGIFQTFLKGFTDMYIRNDMASVMITILIILVFLIAITLIILDKVRAHRKSRQNSVRLHQNDSTFYVFTHTAMDLITILLITTGTNIFVELAFHRGMPATRELLPFLPLSIVTIMYCVSIIKNRLMQIISKTTQKSIFRTGLLILVACVIFSFFSQIDLRHTRDWNDNYIIRDAVYISLNKEQLPSSKYYLELKDNNTLDIQSSSINGIRNPAVLWYARQASYLYQDVDISYSQGSLSPSIKSSFVKFMNTYIK